jgi:hypothetical protein
MWGGRTGHHGNPILGRAATATASGHQKVASPLEACDTGTGMTHLCGSQKKKYETGMGSVRTACFAPRNGGPPLSQVPSHTAMVTYVGYPRDSTHRMATEVSAGPLPNKRGSRGDVPAESRVSGLVPRVIYITLGISGSVPRVIHYR